MIITFITTHYPPSCGFGGVCEAGYGLTNALAAREIFVDVVTSDASKGIRIPFEEFKIKESSLLRIHPFKYLYSERSCFSLNAKRIIRNLISKSDLVYVNGIFTHPATLGARNARRGRKPYIVATRNGLDSWLMKIKRLKKMLGFNLYVKKDLKSSSCIHATSQQEVDACQKMGIKVPFTIIPDGINPSEFRALPESNHAEEFWPILKNRKVLLFLSRLSKEKGLDMLIDAWRQIIKRHPDSILVIAGPDYLGYGNYIRTAIYKTDYRESILFTGNVVGQNKLALYSRADLFVLPSYAENFGIVVAEALISGIPVITTKATPWSELDKYCCGRWVAVRKDAIFEAIDELLTMSYEERREMGRRGKDFILANYTWDIAARKMITVYHAMLNREKIPLYPEPWCSR